MINLKFTQIETGMAVEDVAVGQALIEKFQKKK